MIKPETAVSCTLILPTLSSCWSTINLHEPRKTLDSLLASLEADSQDVRNNKKEKNNIGSRMEGT